MHRRLAASRIRLTGYRVAGVIVQGLCVCQDVSRECERDARKIELANRFKSGNVTTWVLGNHSGERSSKKRLTQSSCALGRAKAITD
jgi:hypothetical protein